MIKELDEKTMKEIDHNVETREQIYLIDFLKNSEDENVREVVEQAIVVIKLIHGEEIQQMLKDYRNDLIKREKDRLAASEIERIKADIERKKIEKMLEKQNRRFYENPSWFDSTVVDNYQPDWKSIMKEMEEYKKMIKKGK